MSQFEAPIARGEDLGDCGEFGDFQTSATAPPPSSSDVNSSNDCNGISNGKILNLHDEDLTDSNFGDVLSGSLEDLVNTFDQRIISCFGDYDEEVQSFAPVQVLSHEEILNESPVWQNLVNNYGNVLPVDWSKSRARALQLAALNLPVDLSQVGRVTATDITDGAADEEEELAKDLDLHSLILNSQHHEPVISVEQVLEEIDELMRDQLTSGIGSSISTTVESSPSLECSHLSDLSGLTSLLQPGKRDQLSVSQLNEVMNEIERMIQSQSEVLINELAYRDELEFEKELKNNFISLLLVTQNKKRQMGLDKKHVKSGSPSSGLMSASSSLDSMKYLTTVIPYEPEAGPPDTHTMQVLIKILKAMNEDSPTVPTLLTDYILKVLCPS